jgi:DNA invertase Pin-like site-specific DNA recombinase
VVPRPLPLNCDEALAPCVSVPSAVCACAEPKAAKQAKIDTILKAGGTPPVINKGGRPKGIPNKVTPTVQTMILKMKGEKKQVALIARELNLSRQTVYEVLKRA